MSNAGADATTIGGATVELDGSASTDAATYAWLQVDGDGNATAAASPVTLSDAAADKPSFIAPDVSLATDLFFMLTVTDNAGLVTMAALEVDVAGTSSPPPVADGFLNVNPRLSGRYFV